MSTSESLLRENKKKQMLPLVGIEPLAKVSKSNMLLPKDSDANNGIIANFV